MSQRAYSRFTTTFTVALAMFSALDWGITRPVEALENGLGRTPLMGWNSWNTFACGANETLIKQMADTVVSSGMKAVGYERVARDAVA